MALLAAHSIRSAFAVLAHVKCISWASNTLTHTDTHTQYQTITLRVFTQVVRPTVPACCVYV